MSHYAKSQLHFAFEVEEKLLTLDTFIIKNTLGIFTN